MGFLDKAKAGLTKVVDQHGDKIAKGVDQAAGALDKQTKGKYTDKIESGTRKAKGAVERLSHKSEGGMPPTP